MKYDEVVSYGLKIVPVPSRRNNVPLHLFFTCAIIDGHTEPPAGRICELAGL